MTTTLTTSMYDASIPVFTQMLGGLKGVLAKAQNTPQADELAATLEAQLPPERLPEARRLLQQEQASRGALNSNTLQLHALQEEDGEEKL